MPDDKEPPPVGLPHQWPPVVRWMPHVWKAAHTEPLALILVFVLVVLGFKLYRGDATELENQRLIVMSMEAAITRIDMGRQRFEELNMKVLANAIDNMAKELHDNSAKLERNTDAIRGKVPAPQKPDEKKDGPQL